MCLLCFFGKRCQEIKKTPNPRQAVPRNAEMYFFTLHLFRFSALPNKLLLSLSPGSTGAHGHYRSIQGACHSWWQLCNRGAIGYLAMLKSAGLCWRFQRGMPSNWCNSPCFVWKVWLFGKSLWSPMKETYIFQALLGFSDGWWWADTCNSEFLLVPGQLAEHFPHRKTTVSWNRPKFLPGSKKRDPAVQKQQRDLPTQTESLQEINSHLFITEYLPPLSTMNSWNIFQLGKLPGAVFPKRPTHVFRSRWCHSFQSVSSSIKANPSNIISLFSLQLLMAHRALGHPPSGLGAQCCSVSRCGERWTLFHFSPANRYRTHCIYLDFNWLCPSLCSLGAEEASSWILSVLSKG